jgi:hypothetical protein
MAAADICRVKAEVSALLHSEIFQENVCPFTEVHEALPPVRIVPVDDRAALVRVPIQEGQRAVGGSNVSRKWWLPPAGVAIWWFDLDYVSAQIAEESAGEGTTQIREIDDAKMRERRGHRPDSNGENVKRKT